jgi:hypothetical protein
MWILNQAKFNDGKSNGMTIKNIQFLTPQIGIIKIGKSEDIKK